MLPSGVALAAIGIAFAAIEQRDLVATLVECVDEMRADEAGAAGDQRLHALTRPQNG